MSYSKFLQHTYMKHDSGETVLQMHSFIAKQTPTRTRFVESAQTPTVNLYGQKSSSQESY